MKETGVIRRLDALGRIVIPREFRKLNRIEVGDPLEMRALEDGNILIRKVDISAQLRSLGTYAVDAVAQSTDKTVGVCSTEEWLVFSNRKCELTGKELAPAATEALATQKRVQLSAREAELADKFSHVTLYPVCGETGIFGAVAILGAAANEKEDIAARTVASVVGAALQTF